MRLPCAPRFHQQSGARQQRTLSQHGSAGRIKQATTAVARVQILRILRVFRCAVSTMVLARSTRRGPQESLLLLVIVVAHPVTVGFQRVDGVLSQGRPFPSRGAHTVPMCQGKCSFALPEPREEDFRLQVAPGASDSTYAGHAVPPVQDHARVWNMLMGVCCDSGGLIPHHVPSDFGRFQVRSGGRGEPPPFIGRAAGAISRRLVRRCRPCVPIASTCVATTPTVPSISSVCSHEGCHPLSRPSCTHSGRYVGTSRRDARCARIGDRLTASAHLLRRSPGASLFIRLVAQPCIGAVDSAQPCENFCHYFSRPAAPDQCRPAAPTTTRPRAPSPQRHIHASATGQHDAALRFLRVGVRTPGRSAGAHRLREEHA